ncbi:MAG: hypothetical protein J0L93_09035 [Deltaproteobacteria bacterium]|nr:hypothetical protein [Deltaproteobacteria bacterium]
MNKFLKKYLFLIFLYLLSAETHSADVGVWSRASSAVSTSKFLGERQPRYSDDLLQNEWKKTSERIEYNEFNAHRNLIVYESAFGKEFKDFINSNSSDSHLIDMGAGAAFA